MKGLEEVYKSSTEVGFRDSSGLGALSLGGG